MAIVLCAVLAATPATAGTLEVRLDHLRPNGSLHVALYRDASSWQRQRGAWTERTLPHPGTSASLRFDDLPPGRYAVSAQQDAVEEWLPQPLLLTLARHGDSGGGTMSRAAFERAAVRVEDADPSIQVHLFTDSHY
jgi:uncharacterized protein (DUF2141 family)